MRGLSRAREIESTRGRDERGGEVRVGGAARLDSTPWPYESTLLLSAPRVKDSGRAARFPNRPASRASNNHLDG